MGQSRSATAKQKGVGAMTREFNWREPIENYRYLPADIFNEIRDACWQGQALNNDWSDDVPEDCPAFMQELEDCARGIRRAAQTILRDPNISFAADDLMRFAAAALNHEVAHLAVILRCGVLELGHLMNQRPRPSERADGDGPQLKVAAPGLPSGQ
jgi:hypothetical protein